MLTSELVGMMKPLLEGWTVAEVGEDGGRILLMLRQVDSRTEEVKTRLVKIGVVQRVRLQGPQAQVETGLEIVVGELAR